MSGRVSVWKQINNSQQGQGANCELWHRDVMNLESGHWLIGSHGVDIGQRCLIGSTN